MGDHMPDTIFPPSDDFKANAIIDKQKYEEMYSESINNPDAFWSKHGLRIDWIKPFTKIKDVSYEHPSVSIKWFEDGELNVCLLYTSPSPRDISGSRMPSSA